MIIGGLVLALMFLAFLYLNSLQQAKNYREAFQEANDIIDNTHYQIEQAQSGKDGESYGGLHERLDSIDIPETVSEPE